MIHFERRRWIVVKPGWRASRARPGALVEVYRLRLDRENGAEQVRDRADVDNRGRLAFL